MDMTPKDVLEVWLFLVLALIVVLVVVVRRLGRHFHGKRDVGPNRKHLPENSDIKRWGPPDDSIKGDW